MAVLRLYGVPVSGDDARLLVATLIADGGPDAIAAAGMVSKGVDRDLYAVGLNPEMRDAILAVLEDPPDVDVTLQRSCAAAAASSSTVAAAIAAIRSSGHAGVSGSSGRRSCARRRTRRPRSGRIRPWLAARQSSLLPRDSGEKRTTT